MKHVLIDQSTSKVVNIVEGDENWSPPPGHLIGPSGGFIGQTLSGQSYQYPASPALAPAQLKSHLAMKGRRIQNSGCVWQGQIVSTKAAAHAAVAQVIDDINTNNLTAPVKWRFSGNFVDLSLSDLLSLKTVLAQHRQACFDKEAALDADIESGAITTVEQIETAGWPG